MSVISIIESAAFDFGRRRLCNMDEASKVVRTIIDDVKTRGDEALLEYTERFDGACLKRIRVTKDEIRAAYGVVDEGFADCLKKAMNNVEKFQKALMKEDVVLDISGGIRVRSLVRPIESIGAYVPGGSAVYVSTAYMIGIPARIAGCSRRVVCTPPDKSGNINPYLLVACDMAGFNEIYKVGGAQAIAAMAYGTQTIGKVDKIFGPGNVFVNAGKMAVCDDVSVDMVAGPSEVMIIADETCDPRFAASDMLSQAEHDVFSSAILLTDSYEVADEVKREIEFQIKKLWRKGIAEKSLNDYGRIVVCVSIGECIEIANEFAPEHLEIMCGDCEGVLCRIRNAGAVFCGNFSSVVMGDYACGTNHVLATMGFAKSVSGLSVDDFVRRMEVCDVTREGVFDISDAVLRLSEVEGLSGHTEAVRVRMEDGLK